MDCQWENWLGITQLSDLLGITTIRLKKDKLKAEKIKLAVFFEPLEHHRALNSKGDFLSGSAGNKSNFSIKGCVSGKTLSKIFACSRIFFNVNWITVLLSFNKVLHLHLQLTLSIYMWHQWSGWYSCLMLILCLWANVCSFKVWKQPWEYTRNASPQ